MESAYKLCMSNSMSTITHVHIHEWLHTSESVE